MATQDNGNQPSNFCPSPGKPRHETLSLTEPRAGLNTPPPRSTASDSIDEAAAPECPLAIKAAPAIRNVYWCKLWNDAVKPEFWKKRPVIVVSHKNTLYAPCLVVPLTTLEQTANKWAYKLPVNYINANVATWAICNHLLTISPARLSSVSGRVPRLSAAEFAPIIEKVLEWLPKPLPQLDR